MGFAGGLWVFPGGRVDEADRDPAVDVAWAGPSPAAWAERLGMEVADARGHVVAACRETLEEAGLLLATPAPGVAELAAARRELLASSAGLAGLLARLGVRLDTARLRYWGWWVTPEAEPRRYDTAFFVAAVPEGQEADARTTEAVEATWWYPADALAGARRGELRLMPPTQHTLEEIAGYADVAGVLAAARSRVVRVHRPVVHRDGRRVVVTVPGDPALRFDVDGLL